MLDLSLFRNATFAGAAVALAGAVVAVLTVRQVRHAEPREMAEPAVSRP